MVDIKRIFAVVLVCAQLFTFVSCSGSSSASGNSESGEAESSASEAKSVVSPGEMTLAFCIADSLNPYTAKSEQNQRLTSLIYESLTSLDGDYGIVYRLARLISGGGKEYTVVLRNGAKFSDGSYVTAEDVIYSYNLAKKSSRYKGCFDNVSSVTNNDGDIIFNLDNDDPNFVNLLDFPIIPDGSKDKTNTYGRFDAPPGSGPYKYVYSLDGQSLEINSNYNGEYMPVIDKIRLYDTPDDEAYRYAVDSGKISLCYSSSIDDVTLPDSLSAQVNLNRLVYIGVNSASSALQSGDVRRAVNFAVDRQSIIDSSYYKEALLPTGLENPAFKASELLNPKFFVRDLDRAAEAMRDAGFTEKSNGGYYVNSKGDELAVKILVNKDNSSRVNAAETVASALAELGIKAEVERVDFKTYQNNIKNKKYDLYIGEVLLPNNLSIAALLDNSKITANGVADDNIYKKYQSYLSGKTDADEFMKLFEKEVPYIPIAYRLGHMTYSPYIRGDVSPGIGDVFAGIEGWSYSK